MDSGNNISSVTENENVQNNLDELEYAFYICQRRAENENEFAQCELGCLYKKGEGTEKNLEKAFYWYQRAAEKGYDVAQNDLATLYYEGGAKRNFETVFHLLCKAEGKGNKIVLCNLGGCYELGIGVEKDESKAFKYYKKSAKRGYLGAKFPLGYCYVNGIGTKVDEKKGFKLYNEAAGKRDDTQNISYENDNKIINDLDKVNYWYH